MHSHSCWWDIYIYIHTWNLFVLYFGASSLQKKAQTPIKTGSDLGSRYISITSTGIIVQYKARWRFPNIFVVFIPKIEEMVQFDQHIFSDGWQKKNTTNSKMAAPNVTVGSSFLVEKSILHFPRRSVRWDSGKLPGALLEGCMLSPFGQCRYSGGRSGEKWSFVGVLPTWTGTRKSERFPGFKKQKVQWFPTKHTSSEKNSLHQEGLIYIYINVNQLRGQIQLDGRNTTTTTKKSSGSSATSPPWFFTSKVDSSQPTWRLLPGQKLVTFHGGLGISLFNLSCENIIYWTLKMALPEKDPQDKDQLCVCVCVCVCVCFFSFGSYFFWSIAVYIYMKRKYQLIPWDVWSIQSMES